MNHYKSIEQKNFLHTLYNVPESSIWCLVNEDDKVVYLCHSISTLDGITRNTKMLRDRSHKIRRLNKDRDILSIKIVEVLGNRNILYCRYRLYLWMKKYKSMGYTLYNEYKPVNYKKKYKIDGDNKVVVGICSSRNKFLKVKSFSTIREANGYMRSKTIEQLLLMYIQSERDV